ncbi:hypothetical protein K525DRAFT_281477, partial [Schizophyllum commune Loenen D]
MTSVNHSRAPSPTRTNAEARSTSPADPLPAAPIPTGYPYNLPPPPEPSSPRTTRQLMLRTEMSESVRQNLLWSRQLARRDMGPPRTRSGIVEQPAARPTIAAQPSVVRLTAPRQQDPAEQQQEQEDIRREMRLARNRTWAGDEFYQTGMSLNEDDRRDYADDGQDYKKWRVQRACDHSQYDWRDGVQSNSNPCSNCSAYGYECTYIQTAKARHHIFFPDTMLTDHGDADPRRESPENRLEKMEKLLRQLCPDPDFSLELGDDIGRERWANKPPPPVDPSPLMKRFKLEEHDIRFFGRSSGAMLVQAAVDLKGELTSVSSSDFWRSGLGSRRPESWQLHPVDIITQKECATYTFLKDNILYALVDLYFKGINTYLPLLHQPTFIAQLIARRHLADESFAPIVLLLHELLAIYLRTIYSINKSKILFGFVGQKWEQQIVAELDSALNKWVDSSAGTPTAKTRSSLVNPPSFTPPTTKILVHRPFIPSPRKPSPLSFPSLALCANAARSLIHIVDIHLRRTGASHGPSMT